MQDVSRSTVPARVARAALIAVVAVLAIAAVWLVLAARQSPVPALTPRPEDAAKDVAQVDGRRCLTAARAATPVACAVGQDDAQPSVAIVGDGAAEELLPAVSETAQRSGWRLTTDLRDGCPLVDAAVSTDGGSRVDCGRPYDARLTRLTHDPDVSHVLLVGSTGTTACTSAGCDRPDRATLEDELGRTIRALHKAGKDVVAVRALPSAPQDLAACVGRAPDDPGECGFALPSSQDALVVAAQRELVPVVDLTDQVCSDGWCPAVADGVLRYRPDGRLTATYASTLADVLGARLVAAGVVAGASDGFGAGALGLDPAGSPAGQVVDQVPWLTPPLSSATRDAADPYVAGCHQNQTDDEPLSCTYGSADAGIVIALVGDSHAAQWQPALRAMVERRGWQLRTYTKSTCLFADVTVQHPTKGEPYTSCASWTRNVASALQADPPTVLIPVSMGGYVLAAEPSSPAGGAIVDGMVRVWDEVARKGVRVLPIADTPWLGIHIRDCVREHPQRLSECAVPRDVAVARSGQAWQRAAVARVSGAELVDLTDVVCPADRCAPVIGNVLVWRDAHHLTATYAASAATLVDSSLAPLVLAASADR